MFLAETKVNVNIKEGKYSNLWIYRQMYFLYINPRAYIGLFTYFLELLVSLPFVFDFVFVFVFAFSHHYMIVHIYPVSYKMLGLMCSFYNLYLIFGAEQTNGVVFKRCFWRFRTGQNACLTTGAQNH